MGKFEVSVNDKGGYHFVLKATNGQVIATSQVYQSKGSCLDGIESVRKNAPEAEVVDLSVDE